MKSSSGIRCGNSWMTTSCQSLKSTTAPEPFLPSLVPMMADLGLFGATLPPQYGCAGMNNVAYGLAMQELERGDSAVRSFASVQSALVMYPDLCLRVRCAEGLLAPPSGARRENRMFRPHGAGLRVEPRRHDHAGGAHSRRLPAERRQDVDHERHRRRRSGGLGEAGRHRARVPGGKGHEGVHRAGDEREAFAPRIGDIGAGVRGRPDSSGEHASDRQRPPAAPVLPDPGALRDCLGSAWRRDGVLSTRR